MTTPKRLALLSLLALASSVPALAETLRCRSVNGNVTCAGSGASSCQTVNGRTTCTSGDGGVVQEFGHARRGAAPPVITPDDERDADEATEVPPARLHGHRQRLEQRGPAGQWLSLEREGSRLRLRRPGLAIDLD